MGYRVMLVYCRTRTGFYMLMKTDEIRRVRLRQAQEKLRVKDVEFADLLEMAPQQLNQLIGPKPTRNIGTALARKIEERLRKHPLLKKTPDGYLDSFDDDDEVRFVTEKDMEDWRLLRNAAPHVRDLIREFLKKSGRE